MAFLELFLNCLIVGLFFMSAVLLIIPLPKTKDIASYAVSLKFIAFTYFYLGVYCLFKSNHYPTDIFCLPFVLTSSLQMQLLGISHYNMLVPKNVTFRYVMKMVIPIILFIIVITICIINRGYHRIDSYDYFIQNLFSLEAPDITVRALWFVYYIALSIYHAYNFLSEEVKMRDRVENYSSEFNTEGFVYIHYSFMVCMLILATTIIVMLSPNQKICAIANLVIILLYFIIGFLYIQYPKAFHIINKMEKEEEAEDATASVQNSTEANDNDVWKGWRTRVINNKYYLRSGLTIVQLAQLLGTNRNTLSATINQQEGKNFNTFINELRIEEAKTIMLKNPNLTLADICTRVGYTDQANFSRHFKNVTGFTPVAWKNSQITA